MSVLLYCFERNFYCYAPENVATEHMKPFKLFNKALIYYRGK